MDKSMQSAHIPDHSVIASLNEQIKVSQQLASSVGSCNACAWSPKPASATVVEVHLRGLAFRLCSPCAEILKAML